MLQMVILPEDVDEGQKFGGNWLRASCGAKLVLSTLCEQIKHFQIKSMSANKIGFALKNKGLFVFNKWSEKDSLQKLKGIGEIKLKQG